MADQLEQKPTNKCEWHEREIVDLKKTIYGNGQEGMKVGMIKLREHVKLLLWLNAIGISAVLITLIRNLLSK